MSGQAILIAALSGRALAEAARKAGFVPYVVDAFGDVDTRRAAAAVRVAPHALARGFTAKTLLALLDEVSEEALCAGHIPVGLVLGAGFEDRPRLIQTLAVTQQLLGCAANSVFASKDPGHFFNLLTELGVRHPQTALDRPTDPAGWLSKRIGGSGGRHVRRLADNSKGRRLRYFQREIEGTVISATALATNRGTALAFAQPWCAPTAAEPFRYGGIVALDEIDADLEARLVDTCRALTGRLAHVGLVSFDFIVDPDGEMHLIEVNPRPGASLDIFEDDAGTLFAAHVAAATGRDGIALLEARWSPRPRAAGYLYADHGPLTVTREEWPDWVSDRPPPGTVIPLGAPVATVIAEAADARAAVESCRERLATLSAVLYEGASL